MLTLDIIQNWRQYIAAVGLIGLSVYQLSQGDFTTAIQSLLAGCAAFAIHVNVVASRRELYTMQHAQLLLLSKHYPDPVIHNLIDSNKTEPFSNTFLK